MDIFKKEALDKLKKENKEIKKLLLDLNKKLIKLEASSEEWNDYLKWKEMKNSLPELDEMFELKTLKELTLERNKIQKIIENLKIGYLDALVKKAAALEFGPNSKRQYQLMSLQLLDAATKATQLSNILTEQINKILLKIKTNKKIKVVEMLKLYGLDSDWILEKND